MNGRFFLLIYIFLSFLTVAFIASNSDFGDSDSSASISDFGNSDSSGEFSQYPHFDFEDDPLYVATRDGNLEAFISLLGSADVINQPKYGGLNLFHLAIFHDHKVILDHLMTLSNMIDFDAKIRCSVLLKISYDISNPVDHHPKPILSINFLQNYGDEEVKFISDRFSPFHSYQVENNRNLLRFNVNLKDATPIQLIALKGNIILFRDLLERGVDLSSKTAQNLNILHFASFQNDLSLIAETLHQVEQGILDKKTVNAQSDDGISSLHILAGSNNIAGASCLIKNGADVNLEIDNGFNEGLNTLFFSSFLYDRNMSELLMENGALINANLLHDFSFLLLIRHLKTSGNLIYLIESADELSNFDIDRAVKRSAILGLYEIIGYLLKNRPSYIYEKSFSLLFSDLVQSLERNACYLNSTSQLMATLEGIFELKPNVNSLRLGTSALHFAAGYKVPEFTRLLLVNGAAVNIMNVDGETPLYKAIKSHQRENIITLLEYGANVNEIRSDRLTALHLATELEQLDTINCILSLSNDIEISAKNNAGGTALHIAVKTSPVIFFRILELNINIDAKDDSGSTALHLAVEAGKLDYVLNLLKRNADLDCMSGNNKTARVIADQMGFHEIVNLIDSYSYLVKNGSISEAYEFLEQYPIENYDDREHETDKMNHIEILFDGLKKSLKSWNTPEGLEKFNNLISDFIDDGFDFNSRNENGDTILHFLAENGYDDYLTHQMIEMLLARTDIKIDEISLSSQKTALQIAVEWNHDETAKILIAHGASVNNYPNGISLLHIAILKAVSEGTGICQYLLEAGADVNAIDFYGLSPLHVSVIKGHYNITELLLKFKADIDVEEKVYNFKPEHFSILKGDVKVFKILRGGHRFGISDLQLAIYSKNPEMVEMILSDASFDKTALENTTLLHLALEDHDAYKDVLDNYGYLAPCEPDKYFAFIHTFKLPNELDYESSRVIILESLLKANISTKAIDSNGLTALHIACQKGWSVAAAMLLDYGADVMAKSPLNVTSLHLAAYSGKISLIDLLLKYNLDINSVDKGYETPLHYFCSTSNGSVFSLKSLLRQNPNVNAVNALNFTALHFCAFQRDLNSFKALCSMKADKNARTSDGKTVLHLAVDGENNEIINYLLTVTGFDVNALDDAGYSALHYAIFHGKINIVRLFLNHESSYVNQRTEYGYTPITVAMEQENIDMIDLLYQYNVDVNVQTYDNGISPFMYVITSGKIDIFNHCIILFGDKIDISLSDSAGWTLLHHAVFYGSLDMVKTILALNPDCHARNRDGHNALQVAVVAGREDIMKLLEPKTLNIFQTDIDGHNVLHVSAFLGRLSMIKYLMNDLYLNSKSHASETPLYMAARGGQADIVEYLLSLPNIDVKQKCNQGKTPLDIAKEEGVNIDADVKAQITTWDYAKVIQLLTDYMEKEQIGQPEQNPLNDQAVAWDPNLYFIAVSAILLLSFS